MQAGRVAREGNRTQQPRAFFIENDGTVSMSIGRAQRQLQQRRRARPDGTRA